MDYKIVLPEQSSPVELNAASELQIYLEKAVGGEFPITREPYNGAGFYVGFTQFAQSHGISAAGGCNMLKGAEAWTVKAAGENLVLTGGRCNTDRGILYAIYHFLEDIIGVRWWNALEEYVPELSDYIVDSRLDISGEPKAAMRFPIACTPVGDDPRFCVRSRSNYNCGIAADWGGSVDASPVGNCHTMDRYLPRAGRYEKHPDWFAWSDEQQKHLPYGQYCLNNPGFIETFEKAFLEHIRDTYAQCEATDKPYPLYFHISMDDTPYGCECNQCKTVVSESGFTGNVLRFVNRMAAKAKEKYPEILVETLAYWTYMEPPADGVVPAENVILRLANIEIDILHDFDAPTNKVALETLQKWSDICKKGGNALAIWDYNINYSGTITPNTLRTAELIRKYEEYGVVGYFFENEKPFTTDFWGLNNWLLTHLFEDSTLDPNKLVDQFLDGYYGPAAGPIREYLQYADVFTCSSNFREKCVETFQKADHITWEYILKANEYFDRAAEAVEYDEVFSRRVRQARITLDLSIVTRYESLMYEAKERGERFPLNRQVSALRYTLSLEESKNLLYSRYGSDEAGRIFKASARHYQNQMMPFVERPLPVEMSGRLSGDVLQVPLYDFEAFYHVGSGMEYVIDPLSWSGKAIRFNLAKAPESLRDQLRATPSGTETPPTMRSVLRHFGQSRNRDFHLEELSAGNWVLHKLFEIDGLGADSNTMISLGHFDLHLSGFGHLFQGNSVSIWILMKATGAFYRGADDQPDALWLDGMFIVKEHGHPV